MCPEMILLGEYSETGLDRILAEGMQISDTGQRIAFLSRHFLGIHYGESSLVGDASTPEVFVINLAEVDCMTFLEYIEAMRRAHSFPMFKQCLKEVRYRSNQISFGHRRHFFSDWAESLNTNIGDVTEQVGGGRAIKVKKRLNEQEDGKVFLEGIEAVERDIFYIPAKSIDDALIARLNTGDYLGIYSPRQGLDVSHVGILVNENGKSLFRHASPLGQYRSVIDQEFREYIAEKPGILVFRGI